MERVSFKVAKVIKEAGYPQGDRNSGLMSVYALEDRDDNYIPYTRIGKLTTNYHCQTYFNDIPFAVAPTYLEVWLWLWREKKICINCNYDKYNMLPMWWCTDEDGINYSAPNYDDPEEAIIATIEYLVDNHLIK